MSFPDLYFTKRVVARDGSLSVTLLLIQIFVLKLSTSVLHSPLYAIAALQQGLQEIVLLFRGVRTIFGKDHESHLSSL